MAQKLHLGCGRTILEGWINLDYAQHDGVDVIADLDACGQIPLPFEDESIDAFFASHLLEHIRNPLPLLAEMHRIATPAASAVFRVPYGSSDDAFEDPTHVKQYFLQSFGYFSQPFYWRADYGYRGDWQTVSIKLIVADKHKHKTMDQLMDDIYSLRNIVSEMIVELHAIKPIREPKRELQTRPHIQIEYI